MLLVTCLLSHTMRNTRQEEEWWNLAWRTTTLEPNRFYVTLCKWCTESSFKRSKKLLLLHVSLLYSTWNRWCHWEGRLKYQSSKKPIIYYFISLILTDKFLLRIFECFHVVWDISKLWFVITGCSWLMLCSLSSVVQSWFSTQRGQLFRAIGRCRLSPSAWDCFCDSWLIISRANLFCHILPLAYVPPSVVRSQMCGWFLRKEEKEITCQVSQTLISFI